MIRSLGSDIRFAMRTMAKRFGVTTMILLTMAVGIGAATAVFSVVESVLLRPLPYPEVDRLVIPRTVDRGRSLRYNTTYPELVQWREEGVFESVTTFARFSADLTGEGEPARLSVMQIGDGYFDTVRVSPILGRSFENREHVYEEPRTVILGESFWLNRFAGSRDVIGRTLRIDDEACTIVGVAPDEAASPEPVDVWLPYQPDTSNPDLFDWDNHAFTAIARLKAGESLRSTNSTLDSLALRAENEHPKLREGETIIAVAMTEYYTGSSLNLSLLTLLGAVSFVLLMGCINIANLLLSVASTRRRELAIRSSLGADRKRLIRQLVVENLLLAPVGGILGILVSMVLVKALVAIAPAGIPRIGEVGLNFPVLAFALGASFVATFVFGIIPALRASSSALATTINRSALTTTASKTERRGRHLLIGLQLALSLSLLAGAGYTMVGLNNLRSSDLGFDTADLVQVPLNLPRARYQPGDPVIGFYDRMLEEVRALPGVASATVRSAAPIGGGGFTVSRSYLLEGKPEPPTGVEISGPWTVVGTEHFQTMGIPLIRGRAILATDTEDSQPVIVVNQRFAELMFGSRDPLGQRVRSWRDENVYREIVGVVGNERYYSVGDQLRPCVYVPHQQNRWRSMSLLVRSTVSPHTMIPLLRDVVSQIDPDLVVVGAATLDQIFERNLAGTRFLTVLLITFAALALLQVGLGIYGVLSYLTAQRNREIGIRIAVGAHKWNVVRMVVTDNFKVVALGLVAGFACVVITGRILQQLLFEVSAMEPLVVLVSNLILVAVALLATIIPAERAASIDPVVALHGE